MEHALQLLRELETTFNFQLSQHATFCVVRDRPVVKKTLCEMVFVVPFKNVLFRDKAEDGDGLVQDNVNLYVCFLSSKINNMTQCQSVQPLPL
jgi:hypothetical protein